MLDHSAHRHAPRRSRDLQRPTKRTKAGWLPTAMSLAQLVWLSPHPLAHQPSRGTLAFDPTSFRTGDVVFRRGRGLASRLVRASDNAGQYSHTGVVSRVADKVWILHSHPAESAEQPGGAVAESLARFLSPDMASAAAVYRPRRQDLAAAAARAAWNFVRARAPFDPAFDLKTEQELYCTELVWRAYQAAGVDLVPGFTDRYLLPSQLEKSPHLQLILKLSAEVEPT
jgi:hypothetical protein